MRVVIVGRGKRLVAAEAGLYSAMKRMGHSVILLDDRKLRQRIGSRAGSRWIRVRSFLHRPQRVIFLKPHDVQVSALAAIREYARITMWYRDLTPPPDPDLDRLVARARCAHNVFLTAGGQAGEWAARGVPDPTWLPNAADRDTDMPVAPDPRFACAVAFMGRGVWPGDDTSRAEFLVRLSKRFHVRVWGQQWDRWARELNWDGSAPYGKDFARVCASAKVVLDIQPALWSEVKDDWYSSNRMVKIMAAGGLCVGQGGAGLQRLFRNDEHCAWYQSDDEAVAQIEKYLSNDALRSQVRQEGRDLVHRHHMLDNRVHNLLTGEPYQNPLEQ
ncbi:MAG: glycosyltransferase family protein [Gemmatimonadota bacterium]